jgi:hypothetical protein
MASIKINPENIVMTFNKDGKLLGLGKTNAGSIVINVPVQKSITGEIDLGNSATNVDKYKKTVAKALLSTDFKTEYKKDDSVIVKLKNSTSDSFLYIPGTIEQDVPAGADATVSVGEGGHIKITDVPLANICSNFKLKENETGFFFSDRVIRDVLKNATVAFGSITTANLNDIIQGTGKITVLSVNGERYDHAAFKLMNGKDIQLNMAKQKSVVPMGFNNVNDINNPEEILLTLPNEITNNTVVFGGKKSKKQKTRKNTMPLQFAPGAKRAYLKRRKSSRK